MRSMVNVHNSPPQCKYYDSMKQKCPTILSVIGLIPGLGNAELYTGYRGACDFF